MVEKSTHVVIRGCNIRIVSTLEFRDLLAAQLIYPVHQFRHIRDVCDLGPIGGLWVELEFGLDHVAPVRIEVVEPQEEGLGSVTIDENHGAAGDLGRPHAFGAEDLGFVEVLEALIEIHPRGEEHLADDRPGSESVVREDFRKEHEISVEGRAFVLNSQGRWIERGQ